MATEIHGKFKNGDRVVVTDEGAWCTGRHGTIGGVFPLTKKPPAYLVHLDDSPTPALKCSWVNEEGLKAEGGTAK